MKNNSQHIKNIFKEVNLEILDIMPKTYLSPFNTLPFEEKKGLIEYRVELGKRLDEEWLMERHEIDEPTVKAYKEKWSESGVKDFIKDKERLGEIVPIDNNYQLFSVFLPKTSNLKSTIFHDKVWDCAANYMNILSNSYTKVFIDGRLNLEGNNALHIDSEEFIKYLDEVDITINNKNLPIVSNIEYRLYRDNKFFYYLNEYFKDVNIDYKSFIKELI